MHSLSAGMPLRGWPDGLVSMFVWNALETSSGKTNLASAASMASTNRIFLKKLVGANDASKSIP
eukprot:14622507-Ditylum_brightwellii.AAC.1